MQSDSHAQDPLGCSTKGLSVENGPGSIFFFSVLECVLKIMVLDNIAHLLTSAHLLISS